MPQPQTEVSILLNGEPIYRRVLAPGEYVIGSAPEAEISFPADELAPRHARLTIGSRDSIIQDLGCSSGTFVNGERVRHVRVVPESHRIEIAGRSISLRRVEDGAATLGDSAVCGPTVSLIRLSATDGQPSQASGPLSFPPRRYEIGGLVATGGMGAILNAFESATERRVAMKIMADPSKTDYRRFLLEARITAQLEHPNIVPVHELAINEEGRPFYTMKLVQGVSLRKVLELLGLGDPDALKAHSLDALLTVFQKVCDAVAFAHSKGVLHRDLKPDNIMLGQYGEALVMDWGLAKLLDETEAADSSGPPTVPASPGASADDTVSDGATLEGDVLGTPNYMSPEQARGEIDRLDVRTDIYSLGAILYHFLTLEPPVCGKTVKEVVAKACAGRIVSPLAAVGDKRLRHLPSGRVPESLNAVAMKALAHDPADRYADVTDLQREIRSYQTGFATAAEQAGAWRLLKLFFFRNLALSSALTFVFVSGAFFLGYMTYEKHQADLQRDTAEARLYLSHLAQVRDDIDAGRPEGAHDLLSEHRVEQTGKDLRGWEWFYALGQLNGDNLRVASAHRDGAFALAASPDGSHFASGGGDGDIVLWKTQGLISEHRIRAAHQKPVLVLAWDRSGRWIASGGADGVVRVWDASTGAPVAETSSISRRPIHALVWNPANSTDPALAFGGPNFDVLLWRPLAKGGESNPQLFYKTDTGVSSLDWSPDGSKLAMAKANQSGGLEVVGLDGLSLLSESARNAAESDVSAVAFDPSGRYVAAASKHRLVLVIELETKKKIFSLPLHTGFVNALAWSPDGSQLASVGDDCAVRIVAPFSDSDGRHATTLPAYPRALNSIVWTKLSTEAGAGGAIPVIIAADATGALREWATGRGQADIRMRLENAVSASHWSPDGRRIAVADFRDLIRINDGFSATSIPLVTALIDVYDLQWSPGGDRLAVANREPQGMVEVLDADTGKWLEMFSLPNANRVAWSSSGKFLAACSPSRACAWDLATDREIWSAVTPAASIVWSRDERRLFVGGADGAIRIWDIAAHKMTLELRAAPPPLIGSIPSKYDAPRQVSDLALSPDEQLLAFVTQDGQAGLLDSHSGKPICVFAGARSGLRRVTWSADGRRVATCGTEGRLRIYDAKEGAQVAQITHGNGERELQGLDWRRDGRQILTGGWDTRVQVWDAERGMQIDEAEQSASHGLTESMGPALLRKLAQCYASVGWVDLTRECYSLAMKASPNSPVASAEALAAEKSFAAALSPKDASAGDPAERLVNEVHANWKHDNEKALENYGALAALQGGAKWLPLAQRYLSSCRWNTTWFPSSVDPVANLEEWRKLGAAPGAITKPMAMLCFPYHRRGPRQLGIDAKLTESGPPAENCGMSATAEIVLPAGKWRFQTEGDGGVRVLVDGQPLVESWRADSTGVHAEVRLQERTATVKITVEHFAAKPCDSFEFLLIPVLDKP